MNKDLALSFVSALKQVVNEKNNVERNETALKVLSSRQPEKDSSEYKSSLDMLVGSLESANKRLRSFERQIEELQVLIGSQLKSEINIEYMGQTYIIGSDEFSNAYCHKLKVVRHK
jgi:hypothetical protein